jgi:hypothetical protein
MQVLCHSMLCKVIIMPLLLTVYCNSSPDTWTVVSLTSVRFKPLIFSVSGFCLPYAANIFFITTLYGFCCLPAPFRYVIVLYRCFKKRFTNITVRRVLRKRLHLKAYKLSIVEHFTDADKVVRKEFCTNHTHTAYARDATQCVAKKWLQVCSLSDERTGL